MNKILAMREKRGEVWDKAKAFLNEHQDENGMLSPEDAAQYERMEQEVVDLDAHARDRRGRETHRLRRPDQLLDRGPRGPFHAAAQ